MEKRATRQSAATLAPPQKRYNAADKQPYNEQGERVYCVCRTTDDGRFMLQCDGCLDWYHGVCVGITERQAKTIGKYSCPYCEQKKNDAIMAALASGANGLIHSNEEYQQGPESIVTAIPTTNRRPPTSRPAPLRRISAATTTTSSSTVPRQANKPLTEPDVGPTSMAWIHDKIRSQVRKSFGETLRGVLADLQAEGITPHSVAQAGERGVKEWVDVTELAGQMEDELFDFTSDGVKGFPRSCGDKYKAKFRSLQYNLKDKKNSHLRARLLSAHLPPHALVRLEAHELANEEIKRQSEAIRLQSIADALKPVVDLGELKKTHKGDVEVVQELEVAVPIPTTAALNGVKRRESPTANEMEETEETEREVVVPAGTGIAGIMAAARASGIAARVAASKPAKVDILDDLLAKIEKPPSPSGAVKRGSSMEALPADGLDSKKGRFEEVSEVSVVGSGWDNLAVSDSWASFDAAGDDMAWIRSPREGEEDMTKPPTREVSPPLETGSTVWTGLVRMPQVGKFNGSCVQIAGRSLSSQTTWEALLPPTVFIEGRIDVNRSQAYITQQRHSSSKEVVAVQFLASSSPSDSEAVGGFKTLLDYFYEKNRHAVVGQKLMAVRDMYLVPVPRGESVPPFLAALTKFNVVDKCDVSDRLFGVLVLDKTFLIELVEKEKREALNRKQPEKMKTSTMTGSLEANKKGDYCVFSFHRLNKLVAQQVGVIGLLEACGTSSCHVSTLLILFLTRT
ncbi:transcription factor S-II, central domain-containing protein [Chytriomyces sp. MP71]|nr:transcription factor S-II, central domain-containing protein [Chytriomyces sp. MP71]